MKDKKEEIRRCGKELFSIKGYKETNVADITKMAGMATGTFYNYYSSKDKLFMEIFLEENVKLKKSIMGSIDMEGAPATIIMETISRNLEGMRENPILRQWYNRESFARIEQSYREENGIEHMDFLYDAFIELVRQWQAQGKMRSDIDADMIMAIFAALINVDTHKEEIGLKYFPEVQEHLTGFVMKGLMEKGM